MAQFATPQVVAFRPHGRVRLADLAPAKPEHQARAHAYSPTRRRGVSHNRRDTEDLTEGNAYLWVPAVVVGPYVA